MESVLGMTLEYQVKHLHATAAQCDHCVAIVTQWPLSSESIRTSCCRIIQLIRLVYNYIGISYMATANPSVRWPSVTFARRANAVMYILCSMCNIAFHSTRNFYTYKLSSLFTKSRTQSPDWHRRHRHTLWEIQTPIGFSIFIYWMIRQLSFIS